MNSPDSSKATPSIETMPLVPTDGIRLLSRLWAGSGNLHDWLVPSEWAISRLWSAEVVRARFAECILQAADKSIAGRLPTGSAAWLDQFESQLIRNTAYTDLPTAHTDWALTLSQFGRYPSPQYVDRRPINTLESALSRVSIWLADAVEKAEKLVRLKFNRTVLSDAARSRLTAPAKVARILALTAPDKLYEEDLLICASAGGPWPLISKMARQLAGIWQRDAATQLAQLPPMLPALGSQLFELATLGVCALVMKAYHPKANWSSCAPIGASEKQLPCLGCEDGDFRWSAYYQIVPKVRRQKNAPYETLGMPLSVQPLRPDVWLMFEHGLRKTELIIESKYSLDPSYVASGITQVLGYSFEHPIAEGWRRLYMVVGPKEIISSSASWNGDFFIGNLEHLRELIERIANDEI